MSNQPLTIDHQEVFKAAVRAGADLLEPGEEAHPEYTRGMRDFVQRFTEQLEDPESRKRGEQFVSELVDRGLLNDRKHT